jgi:hypothetical protein
LQDQGTKASEALHLSPDGAHAVTLKSRVHFTATLALFGKETEQRPKKDRNKTEIEQRERRQMTACTNARPMAKGPNENNACIPQNEKPICAQSD